MKKELVGIAILGVSFVLAGCGAQNSRQEQVQLQEKTQQQSSTISSIKDAMGLGKKMKCEYVLADGKDSVKAISYVEGKNFKSTVTVGSMISNTVFDGETMYSWSDGQGTGMKMKMSCMEKLGESMPQDQKNGNGAPIEAPEDHFKNATDVDCVLASDNVDFSVPAGITFTDQCEMMEKSMEMMKNIKLPGNLPQGAPNFSE